MINRESIVLQIKEGNSINYMKAVSDAFQHPFVDDRFKYDLQGNHIIVSCYKIIPDFEIIVTQSTCNRDIVVCRTSDERPDFFHFNLMKEGQAIQKYNDQQQYMEAGRPTGAFIYNGLFPLQSKFPANLTVRSIGFKASRGALKQMMPEGLPIIDQLFADDSPQSYHISLTHEMEKLIEDVFLYENSLFGRKMQVMAHSMQIFTLLLSSIKALSEKDELQGLHIDDYNRLLQIKDEIIQHIEQKLNLEELASQFAISVSKLQRDFKALFNSSVYQFYTHAKMDEAYRRLKTGEFSVMEVGYDLGYSSLSKFSSMFKKVKGISPKEVMAI